MPHFRSILPVARAIGSVNDTSSQPSVSSLCGSAECPIHGTSLFRLFLCVLNFITSFYFFLDHKVFPLLIFRTFKGVLNGLF